MEEASKRLQLPKSLFDASFGTSNALINEEIGMKNGVD